MFSAIADGTIEAGGMYFTNIQAVIPEWYGWSDASYYDVELAAAMEKKFCEGEWPFWDLGKACEQHGFMMPAFYAWGNFGNTSGIAGTGKPVIHPEDLQGRKVRSFAYAVFEEFMKSYRGIPVYVSGAELFTALERGTIDATIVAAEHMISRKLVEPCDWYIGGVPLVSCQASN